MERGTVSLDMTDLRTYDDYTYAHSVNVAVICCVIGVGMELSESELTQLATAALLHDLGKLSIPPEILNKPGRLTQEEYQIMKSHATLSYELIRERWDIPANVKTAVLYHHENVDGSGYPQGIDASQQSLFIRILHVADVYDALVSKRPYKEPYSPYEASEYLMGACGIMFDKKLWIPCSNMYHFIRRERRLCFPTEDRVLFLKMPEFTICGRLSACLTGNC